MARPFLQPSQSLHTCEGVEIDSRRRRNRAIAENDVERAAVCPLTPHEFELLGVCPSLPENTGAGVSRQLAHQIRQDLSRKALRVATVM